MEIWIPSTKVKFLFIMKRALMKDNIMSLFTKLDDTRDPEKRREIMREITVKSKYCQTLNKFIL